MMVIDKVQDPDRGATTSSLPVLLFLDLESDLSFFPGSYDLQ